MISIYQYCVFACLYQGCALLPRLVANSWALESFQPSSALSRWDLCLVDGFHFVIILDQHLTNVFSNGPNSECLRRVDQPYKVFVTVAQQYRPRMKAAVGNMDTHSQHSYTCKSLWAISVNQVII